MLSKILISLVVVLGGSEAWSHARLVAPTPRNTNAGIKTPECGGVARTATPTVLVPGQQLTVQIVETINHPGRFYIDFSAANDTNWQRLATIVDDQNAPPVPHNFTGTITVPNTPCAACTLRVIQSMEENPAAPTFYYSCADIVISTTATPSPTMPPGGGGGSGGNGGQSGGDTAQSAPRMGGCASVDSSSGGTTGGGSAWFLLVLPLVALAVSRRSSRRAV